METKSKDLRTSLTALRNRVKVGSVIHGSIIRLDESQCEFLVLYGDSDTRRAFPDVANGPNNNTPVAVIDLEDCMLTALGAGLMCEIVGQLSYD